MKRSFSVNRFCGNCGDAFTTFHISSRCLCSLCYTMINMKRIKRTNSDRFIITPSTNKNDLAGKVQAKKETICEYPGYTCALADNIPESTVDERPPSSN